MKGSAPLRRFESHFKPLRRVITLEHDHAAVTEGRSLFPSRVRNPGVVKRVLKSGMHSRKIGDRVSKGWWSGSPIFTLTLEERASCPQTCAHWADCYGNHMHFSIRHNHGSALEQQLGMELWDLSDRHPDGFVVRLHVLGDFYSLGYVRRWISWMRRFDPIRAFGYTAHDPLSPTGSLLRQMRTAFPGRWFIRHSNAVKPVWSTRTLYHDHGGSTFHDAIVCPAQTGASACCGTCALCWSTQKPIAFLAH